MPDIKGDVDAILAAAIAKGMLECNPLTIDAMRKSIMDISVMAIIDTLSGIMKLPGVMEHIMSGNGFPDDISNQFDCSDADEGLMDGVREEVNELISNGADSDIIYTFILDRSKERIMEILPGKLTDENMLLLIETRKELNAKKTPNDVENIIPKEGSKVRETIFDYTTTVDEMLKDVDKAVNATVESVDQTISITTSSSRRPSPNNPGIGVLGWCSIAGTAALALYGGYKLFYDNTIEDTIVIDLDNAF